MATLTIALDPRFPVVWQDPSTLQIGIDPPRVVLPGLDDRFLPLLHGLGAGLTPGGIDLLAGSSSITPGEVAALIEQLTPALRQKQPHPASAFVLDAARVAAHHARAVWEAAGYTIADYQPGCALPDGEVVLMADFVLDPDQHQRWLRRDRTHTPILFTDQAVRIGPRVLPGSSPCLFCLFQQRVDANPATVALDSQLWGVRAASRIPALEARAAWLALELAESGELGRVLRLDATSLDVTSDTLDFHPDCDCRGWSSSRAPEENDW